MRIDCECGDHFEPNLNHYFSFVNMCQDNTAHMMTLEKQCPVCKRKYKISLKVEKVTE